MCECVCVCVCVVTHKLSVVLSQRYNLSRVCVCEWMCYSSDNIPYKV